MCVLGGWSLIQQGEAKRALEVLQKPAVPIDLQVHVKVLDLYYGQFSQLQMWNQSVMLCLCF